MAKILQFPGSPKKIPAIETKKASEDLLATVGKETLDAFAASRGIEAGADGSAEIKVAALLAVARFHSKKTALGSPNPVKVRELRKGVVGTYSLEELTEWLNKATDLDLSSRPTFYQAILEETQDRTLR